MGGGAGSSSNSSNKVTWAEAYLHTKWYLNPSSHLATIHQLYRQTDRQTGQENGTVAQGKPLLVLLTRKLKPHSYLVAFYNLQPGNESGPILYSPRPHTGKNHYANPCKGTLNKDANHARTHQFNGYFPCEPRLARCALNFRLLALNLFKKALPTY